MIKLPIHAATVPEPVAIDYIKDDSQMLHGVRHAPYGTFGCVKQSMQLVCLSVFRLSQPKIKHTGL